MLAELVDLQDLVEHSRDRKVFCAQDGERGPERCGVVRIAGRGHGKATALCVLKGENVVAAESGGSIENFERVNRQRFQDRLADSRPKQIIRVRWNGESAALVNDLANFPGRSAFQIVWQAGPDAKQVTFRGGYFLAGNDEKTVDRLTIRAHQALIEAITDRVGVIVVCNGEPVQTLGAGGGNIVLRTRYAITRKPGVGMEVDIERHPRQASLRGPEMQSVGFKEWALICEALGRGEQTILLRKGGIAEGRDGFAFKHREFFLFPTFFHEQLGKVRGPARALPQASAGEIQIKYFARLQSARVVTSWEDVLALEPLHVLTRDVVRERFDYDQAPGVHVGFVRVYRLEPVWILPDEAKYGGCRSWVQLPEPPPLQLEEVGVAAR